MSKKEVYTPDTLSIIEKHIKANPNNRKQAFRDAGEELNVPAQRLSSKYYYDQKNKARVPEVKSSKPKLNYSKPIGEKAKSGIEPVSVHMRTLKYVLPKLNQQERFDLIKLLIEL